MGKLSPQNVQEIREMYLKGTATDHIGKLYNISGQRIRQLAKENNWAELKKSNVPAKSHGDDLVLLRAKDPENYGKAGNECVKAAILNELAKGVSLNATAKRVGLHGEQLKRWRNRDPEFDLQCHEFQGDFVAKLEAMAGDVVDSKSALNLLARHPLTKSEWTSQDQKGGGITVNLNFDRNSMGPKPIEGECEVIENPQVEFSRESKEASG